MVLVSGIGSIVLAAALPVFDFATNSIAERVTGSDSSVAMSRFADYPPSRGRLGFPGCLFLTPFPGNERFWLKDVDFSCVSPWNDTYGSERAGTLISKRHIVFAKHFPLGKGTRILFVGRDGEVCPCRVQASKVLPKCDIAIGLLDYEVTPNIHPAKILPEDYAKYIDNGKGLPVVTFNRREQTLLSRLRAISAYGVANRAETNVTLRAFGGKIVKGDSGNPAFLLIGTEPILLYCLYGGGSGSGPSLFHHRTEIQKTMDELCPGYKLETFDFEKVRCGDGK